MGFLLDHHSSRLGRSQKRWDERQQLLQNWRLPQQLGYGVPLSDDTNVENPLLVVVVDVVRESQQLIVDDFDYHFSLAFEIVLQKPGQRGFREDEKFFVFRQGDAVQAVEILK